MFGPILALAGGAIALLLLSRSDTSPSAPSNGATQGPAPGVPSPTVPGGVDAVSPGPGSPGSSFPVPGSGNPSVLRGGWALEGGFGYNFTQAVHDVPDAQEMQAVVASLASRGHSKIITARNKTAPTEWVVNYDSFPLPNDLVINRGQQSKMGPYGTSVLDISRKGDLSFFNGAMNA